jgi:hypothetical protein
MESPLSDGMQAAAGRRSGRERRDDDAANGGCVVHGGGDPAFGGRLREGRQRRQPGDQWRDGQGSRRLGSPEGERAGFTAGLTSFATAAGVVPVAADDLGNVRVGAGLVSEPWSHR